MTCDQTYRNAGVKKAQIRSSDGEVTLVLQRPTTDSALGARCMDAPMLRRHAGAFRGWPVWLGADTRDRGGMPRPPSELGGEIVESWWDASYTAAGDAARGHGPGAVIARAAVTDELLALVRRIPGTLRVQVDTDAQPRPVLRAGRRRLLVESFSSDPERGAINVVTAGVAGGGHVLQEAAMRDRTAEITLAAHADYEVEDGRMRPLTDGEKAARRFRDEWHPVFGRKVVEAQVFSEPEPDVFGGQGSGWADALRARGVDPALFGAAS